VRSVDDPGTAKPPDPGSAPVGPAGRSPGVGGAGAILYTAAGLYRRRSGPLVLIATIFLVPSALVGVLEERAATEVPAPPPGADDAKAADGGLGAPVAREGGAGAAPAVAPVVGPATTSTPGPPADEFLSGLTARDAFERAVWLFIGSLFTSMLAAAVAREAALAVTGRAPAPVQSAGYGFAHVLGLAFLGVLAAAWSLFLLLLAFPAFLVLSLLQKGLSTGIATALAFLLALPVALVFATLASLGIPVFVLEGRRGMNALLRVWTLVRGEVRHVAVTVSVILAIGLAASGLATAIAAATGASIGPGLAAGIVGAPFEALVAFFLYLDLRSRKEPLTVARLETDLTRNAP